MSYQDIGNIFLFHYHSLKYLCLLLLFFLSLVIFLFIHFRGKNLFISFCFFLGLSQVFHFVANSVYDGSTVYYHFFALCFTLIGSIFLSNFISYYFYLFRKKYLFLFIIFLQFLVLFFYLNFYNSKIVQSSIFFDFSSQNWTFNFTAFNLDNVYYLYSFLIFIFTSNFFFIPFCESNKRLQIVLLSTLSFLAFFSLPSLHIFLKQVVDFNFLSYFSLTIFFVLFVYLLDLFSVENFISNLSRIKAYLISLALIFSCFLVLNENIFYKVEKNFYRVQFSNLFNPYSKILIADSQSYRFQYNKEQKSFYMHVNENLDFNFNDIKASLVNAQLYNEIKLLEADNFYIGVHDIVAQSPRFFRGYESSIVSFLKNSGRYPQNPKEELLSRLKETSINVVKTKNDLELFFNNHKGEFYCRNIFNYLKDYQLNKVFINSILKEIQSDCTINGKVYSPVDFHSNLLTYFQPIYDPDFKVYRTTFDKLTNYISFIYYNQVEDEIGEAGIDYTLYRKSMHETFIVQILSLFAIIFVVFVFIPIFVKKENLKRDEMKSDDINVMESVELNNQEIQEVETFMKPSQTIPVEDYKIENIFNFDPYSNYENERIKVSVQVFNPDMDKNQFSSLDNLKFRNTSFMVFSTVTADINSKENNLAASLIYSSLLSCILSWKKRLSFEPKDELQKLSESLEDFSRTLKSSINISYSVFILDEITFDSWFLNIGKEIKALIYKDNRAYDIQKQIQSNNIYYNKIVSGNSWFFVMNHTLINEYLDSIEKVYGSVENIKTDDEINKLFMIKLTFNFEEKKLKTLSLNSGSLNYDEIYLNGNGVYSKKYASSDATSTLLKTQEKVLNDKKIDFLLSSLNLKGEDYQSAVHTLKEYLNSGLDQTKPEYWFYSALENKNVNQYEKSIEAALKFESLKTDHIPNLLLLTDIYYIEGDFVKCLDCIEKILKVSPNHQFVLRLKDLIDATNDTYFD